MFFYKFWSKYFIDIVHPTDAGYAGYFDAIREFLESELVYGNAYSDELKTAELPEKINDTDFTPTYITTDKLEVVSNKNWDLKANAGYPTTNSHPGYYTTTTDDNSITIKFTGGTNVAFFADLGQNRVYYSFDGTGDEKILASNGNHPFVLSTNKLENPDAEHTITIRVKNKSDKPFSLHALLVW